MVIGTKRPKNFGKTHEQVIKEFLDKKGMPDWYRGNSVYQSEAYGSLWYSIRDDIAQATTYRTYANLCAIGLKPMVKTKQIKLLLELCRGSDIFFLWALKELYYKSKEEHVYSTNEQLIMSAIVRLDMVTTLRGLDKLLPPPQPPKQEIRKKLLEELRIKREEIHKCRVAKAKAKRNIVNAYGRKLKKSPYRERQPRPHPIQRRMFSEPPHYKVNIGWYEIYKDKYYRVDNEKSRWFANYTLQPGKRAAKYVIDKQIDNMFDNFNAAKIKAETVHQMCEHHKDLKELEESLRMKMQAVMQEKFEGYFDTKAKKKSALAKSWLAKMEMDQSAFLSNFCRLANDSRNKYTVLLLKKDIEYENLSVNLRSEDCAACKVLPDCPPCPQFTYDEDAIGECNDERFKKKPKPFSGDRALVDHSIRKISHTQRTNQDENEIANLLSSQSDFNPEDLIYKDERELKRLRLSNYSRGYVAPYDYGGPPELITSESSLNKFFTAPGSHTPHCFDYRKVFRYVDNTPSKIDIRKTFVNALNNDIDKLIELQEERVKSRLTRDNELIYREQKNIKRVGEWEKPKVGKAVTEYVRKTFLKGAKEKGKEIAAQEAEERRKEQAKLQSKMSLASIFREKFNQEYYDPDDKPLMHAMLKYALELLAKDPKYVLPALPDVHKLAFFREFICLRYGKVYTKKERFKSYNDAFKVMMSMQKGSLNVRLPSESEMAHTRFSTYNCLKYIKKKSRYITKKFNDEFDEAVLSESRLLWFAMRPYLCGRPPRKLFFAYMPEDKNHIKHFKVWNANEVRDVRTVFEKRWAEQKALETQ